MTHSNVVVPYIIKLETRHAAMGCVDTAVVLVVLVKTITARENRTTSVAHGRYGDSIMMPSHQL